MEVRRPQPLSQVWMKAAVIGSLWASVEIILGSFLHNLRFPMSGTVLAFISVYLLTAFGYMWREPGVIWRAGLICALMKSISPSALILGPMIGIFTEAVLLEISLFLLGRTAPGFLLGGALAVFSTILHKTVSLLILYGFDLVKILESLYKFAVRQLGMEQIKPMVLIAIISIIYMLTGMVAAALGMRAGRRYLAQRNSRATPAALEASPQNRLFAESSGQSYSVLLLPGHIAAVVAGLFLINFNYYLPATIFCLAYVILVLTRYKNSVRHFRKAGLWVQFILLTLMAAFLWEGISKGVFFTWQGLAVGLKMAGRAMLIISGFAAIGVELRNPVIKSILYNQRFSNLYQALSLAFSVLPHILAGQPKSKELLSKSSLTLQYLFQQAEVLPAFLEAEHQRRPPIMVITGEIRQGKTTFLKTLLRLLEQKDISVGGFLALGVHENGARTGFELYDITSRETLPLCTTQPVVNAVKTGSFFFFEDGLKKGRQLLRPEAAAQHEIVVIDELGPMELGNKGWSESVETLIRHACTPQIWVVRRSLVEKMLRKWNIGQAFIIDIGTDTAEDAAGILCNMLEIYRDNTAQ